MLLVADRAGERLLAAVMAVGRIALEEQPLHLGGGDRVARRVEQALGEAQPVECLAADQVAIEDAVRLLLRRHPAPDHVQQRRVPGLAPLDRSEEGADAFAGLERRRRLRVGRAGAVRARLGARPLARGGPAGGAHTEAPWQRMYFLP